MTAIAPPTIQTIYPFRSQSVPNLSKFLLISAGNSPVGWDPGRNWCNRHTTSMIKLFWSQPMVPWASAAAYIQGEKFSTLPTTDVKLGTSGL